MSTVTRAYLSGYMHKEAEDAIHYGTHPGVADAKKRIAAERDAHFEKTPSDKRWTAGGTYPRTWDKPGSPSGRLLHGTGITPEPGAYEQQHPAQAGTIEYGEHMVTPAARKEAEQSRQNYIDKAFWDKRWKSKQQQQAERK